MVTQDPVPATNWYTWSVTGSPIQVRLPLLLVHELRRRLDRPLDADSAYIHESGFLIGRTPRPGITQITGFHPVPRLDPPTVLEALTSNRGNFVGFYRTTPSGSLSLSPDDLLLAEAYFHQASSVILMIETGPVGPEEAAFFVWRKGRIDGPPLLPFPFDTYQLSGSGRPAIAEPTEPQPLKRESRRPEIPPAIPEPEVSEPKPRDRAVPSQPDTIKRDQAAQPKMERAIKRDGAFKRQAEAWLKKVSAVRIGRPAKRGLQVAAVLALAGIAAYLGIQFRSRKSIPSTPPPASTAPAAAPSVELGLTAERSGSNLTLSWDTTSPAIVVATKGALLIQAGSEHQEVALDREQLRSGNYLYKPTGDHLSIRLQVTGPDNSVQDDSMAVFLPRETNQRPVVVPRQSSSRTAVAAPTSPPTPASAPESKAEPKNRPLELPPAASTVASPTKAAPPRLDEAPPVVANPRVTPVNPLFSSPVSIPRPATAADSNSTTENTTASSPHAPVPLYQEVPKFPAELKATLLRSVMVEVAVKIDSNGRVIKADALPGNAHVLLKRSAVEAARNWKFRPATVNGIPVASDMVLKFNFTPNK